ncbi:uncharacterized protein L3040_005057 [Drepanopeziza brunnea f. sp. 'multigermtubi']|uniref:uncharacterized protein n=1 Tax=Drepanopeziza brunnea f. sp. 'multigermtubi' TaxID=698441 RepID=UPI00238C5C25|nr:hypothetical protein L3040_005057 [Drepanopeziza brunnea f. sp. 'multigermtubi']
MSTSTKFDCFVGGDLTTEAKKITISFTYRDLEPLPSLLASGIASRKAAGDTYHEFLYHILSALLHQGYGEQAECSQSIADAEVALRAFRDYVAIRKESNATRDIVFLESQVFGELLVVFEDIREFVGGPVSSFNSGARSYTSRLFSVLEKPREDAMDLDDVAWGGMAGSTWAKADVVLAKHAEIYSTKRLFDSAGLPPVLENSSVVIPMYEGIVAPRPRRQLPDNFLENSSVAIPTYRGIVPPRPRKQLSDNFWEGS